MKFVQSLFFCLFCVLALAEKLSVQIILDPTDESSMNYIRDEVAKISNTDMNHYVVMDVLPFGKCTIDMETKEVTVPGDERMREYLALESCVSENAELHQIVSFYRCINEFKDNLDINLREECTAAAKIIDKETLECFDDLDRALVGLGVMTNKVYSDPVPYYPFVLIEGKVCDDSCPDLYHKICEYYPAGFKPYLCRIPSPKPVDVFDNDGAVLAHYENPRDAPGYQVFEKIKRNIDNIPIKVVFDPTKEEEHNFIKLFEDFLYKDFRFFTTITFYPVGSIPLSEKQENGTYKRDCGESDPDCKITKHMICGNYKGEYSNIIGYWSYLQCMVRHGEYMFRNVDYCASSGHIDSKSVHECIEGEVGDQLLDEFIRVRNEDFKEVEPKDLPTVYLNKDKCTNNCGDMYPRLCNKIPGKLPTYCGGDQRLKFVPPPCKECRREEVMRPPGEVGSIPVEIFTDASCKWGNKFLMGPMTWLVNHKRFVNSVDLHIHNSMGCYVDQMGTPVCPFGAHQTTQNLILTCARDLWPDYKIHNPLILCFAKHFNEYEKYIDECADASNVDPQSIVDCVNDGRGIKAMERYFKRTRYQFDPVSLPAVKIKNETVYDYNRSVELLCKQLDPVPKFCKKLPKFPKKSPRCVADDLSTWPEM